MNEENINCFADSITYVIERTAIYLRLKGAQLFSNFGLGITLEQYIMLDTIYTHRDICQRDLSKLILKDRSNTGRILNILEKKGLLERRVEIKNNRLVKKIYISETGETLVQKHRPAIKEAYMQEINKIPKNELETLRRLLEKVTSIIKEETLIQI